MTHHPQQSWGVSNRLCIHQAGRSRPCAQKAGLRARVTNAVSDTLILKATRCHVPRDDVSGHTFYEIVQAGYLACAVQRVDAADALGQVAAVRQGFGELHEQRTEGPEAIARHRVRQTLEVSVPIAVETHFLGLLLRAESLQGPCAVEAAVGAVRWTRYQAAAPGSSLRARAGPARSPLRLVPLVKVLQFYG